MRSGLLSSLALTVLLASCGGGGASTPPPQGSNPPPPATYSVGGTVTGLTGTLVLRVNDATDISVNANGAVTLASSLANGASYSVAVKTQPSSPTQKCDLGNATGTVASANVSNVTVTCTAVPLTLASSTPANGVTGATRDAPLTLTFSTTIDASAAAVVLTGPAGAVSTSTQVSGADLVVTPTTKLAKFGAYTLTVGAVKGTGGELLAAPVVLGFEAADGTWSTPSVLATKAGDAGYARIAMDAKGNALAVWAQSNGGAKGIAANHWTTGSGWDGARRVDSNDFGAAAMPDVRFDHDGNALALWVQGSGARTPTWFSRFEASGTWGSATQISSGKNDTAWPTLAFDANGDALAMWENTTIPTADAFNYSPSSGWTGAAFPVSSKPVRDPHICIDSTGRAQVVWTVVNGAITQVQTASHGNGEWGGTVVLMLVDGPVNSLRIVCPATGGAFTAWVSPETGVHHVHASWLTDGGWTGPVTLDKSPVGAVALSLFSDATGNITVLWSQFGSTGGELWIRRLGIDRVLSAAQRIDDPAAGNPSEPELALDAGGNGWAVWRVSAAGKPSRISAARARHGEFSPPQIIDPDTTEDAAGARVAVDQEGNAIAVWLNCPSNCYVMTSRFE